MNPESELRARRFGVRWLLFIATSCVLVCAPLTAVDAQNFIRGDANNDSGINIADAIFGLNHLFNAGTAPVNANAMDTNDNGVLEISDVVYLLRLLFVGGPNPPAPYPAAGPDTTPPAFPGAPTGAIAVAMNAAAGCPGSQTRVAIDLTSNVTIEALSLRVIFDPAAVTLSDVDCGDLELILGNPADFFATISFAPGEVTIGILFSLINPVGQGLPPQTAAPIIDLIFAVGASVGLGTVIPIEFEDAPQASPPGYNLGSVLGEVERASVTAGSITANCMQTEFRRGDTNQDGATSISDAVFLIAYLFLSGAPSGCLVTCDSNGDASIDVGDVVYMLNALFTGGASIPAPWPNCGREPTASGIACPTYTGNCP